MSRGIVLRFLAPLALVFLTGAAAPAARAADLDDQLALNTSITSQGGDIQLGDIFTGYLSRPEKVVAQAPRPGQRLVLTAEWLTNVARTYGLNWRPANGYDRTVVYHPGRVIAQQDILNAVKADLIAKGMPANYAVAPAAALPSVTVAAASITAGEVGIRESYFEQRNGTFSAVVEIPPGDAHAQFISFRGRAYAVVAVPTVKENVPKNTVITSEMITIVDLPEDQMKADTLTDVASLVGKAPRVFLRAGAPIRDTEVAQMILVDVPVLTVDAARDTKISEANVVMTTFNAADLPRDVITDAELLIGKNPRRYLAARAPIRRADVQSVREVRVPVATHDLSRGTVVSAADLNWIVMNDNVIAANVVTDSANIIGRETKHPIRSGQMLRTHDIALPIAIERGRLITILWSTSLMNLTVQGLAQEAGGVGDVIRVINTKSKTSVLAEVIDAQTVRVSAQQTAMAK